VYWEGKIFQLETEHKHAQYTVSISARYAVTRFKIFSTVHVIRGENLKVKR